MQSYCVLGLMSGTSLDGLDICRVRFELPSFRFEILEAETLNYSVEWKYRLQQAIHLSGEELTRLDVEYGRFLAQSVRKFIGKHQIQNLDAIASHGHTIFHNPNENYTLQIGNGQLIFAETGIPVVYDFRSQDVFLGGQGAPLVPIGDQILFGEYDACLNLGGFSNISFKQNQNRIAFDICPVNVVMNSLAQDLGFDYDDKGHLAASGELNLDLLDELNALEFYALNPPKSLGIEWVHREVFPILNRYRLSEVDALATFSRHIAEQIASVLNSNQLKTVLVTGGGAYNAHLIQTLQKLTSTQLIIPDPKIIDYKEALIFGLMGVLKLEGQINVLHTVTGAKYSHSSGVVAS